MVAAGASLVRSGDIAAMLDRNSTSVEPATHSLDPALDHSLVHITAAGSEATDGTIRAPGFVDGSDYSQWASASIQIMTVLSRITCLYAKAGSTDSPTGGKISN